MLPFDEKNAIIPSSRARVVLPNKVIERQQNDKSNEKDSELPMDAVVPGVYVVGWLRRGASGIIGSNIGDAREAVKSILEDISTNVIRPPPVCP